MTQGRLTSKRDTFQRLQGQRKCHRVSGAQLSSSPRAKAVEKTGQAYSKRVVRPANYRPRCRSYLRPGNQLKYVRSVVLFRGRDQTLPRVKCTGERIRTGSRRMHVGVTPARLLKFVRTSEGIFLMRFDLVSLRGVLWWCNSGHAAGGEETGGEKLRHVV